MLIYFCHWSISSSHLSSLMLKTIWFCYFHYLWLHFLYNSFNWRNLQNLYHIYSDYKKYHHNNLIMNYIKTKSVFQFGLWYTCVKLKVSVCLYIWVNILKGGGFPLLWIEIAGLILQVCYIHLQIFFPSEIQRIHLLQL